MLTKLLPDQISKFWDIIKYAIEQSLPPVAGEHHNKMNNILFSALDVSIDVWASRDKNNKFEGIVLTEILIDRPTRTKNLLIYCLYGYNKISELSWKSGFETLVKYAKGKGCSQIVAYTDVDAIIDVVNRLGGEAKYNLYLFRR
jgi:hypothetical protein